MMPASARVAWTAGLAQQAWNRLSSFDTPLPVTARAELALLAADADLGRTLLSQCGHLAAPSMASLAVLAGDVGIDDGPAESTGRRAHRSRMAHPSPSVEPLDCSRAATDANVVVCDLAQGQLPDPKAAPTRCWTMVLSSALSNQ